MSAVSDNDEKNREDIVSEILKDFEHKEDSEQKEVEVKEKRAESQFLFRAVFYKLFVFFLIIISVVAGSVLLKERRIFSSKAYWITGKEFRGNRWSNKEVKEFWEIRKMTDKYYSDKKYFPESLRSLYEEGYFKKELVCSATKKPYIEKQFNEEKVVCCPDSNSYSVSELCIYLKSGPPFIDTVME